MSSNAASRVFGVPELLEHILLYYAHNDAANTGRTHFLEPRSRLFVIQRTSRDFQGTVEGSKALRRLMYLEPVDFSKQRDAGAVHRHGPLGWLLERLGLYWPTKMDYKSDNSLVSEEACFELNDLNEFDFTWLADQYFDPNFECCWSAWLRRESSWRKTRVCHSTVPSPVSLSMTYCSGSAREDDEAELHHHTWTFQSEDTLGHVHDRFETIAREVARMQEAYEKYKQSRIERRFGTLDPGKPCKYDEEHHDRLDILINKHLSGEGT